MLTSSPSQKNPSKRQQKHQKCYFMLHPERTVETYDTADRSVLHLKKRVMLADIMEGKDLKESVVLLFFMQRCSFDLKCLNSFIFMPIKHHKHLHVIGKADLGP